MNRMEGGFFMLVRLLVASFALVLVSCGDSGVGSGGSGFPSGVQTGTVNGFGSVIVDSTTYDDGPAQVTIDLDGESTGELNRDDVRLGMQVRLTFEQDGVASTIEITPQLVGEIESVDTASLVVSGQNVSVQARGARATVFVGFTRLSDLGVGERITVYGLVDETGRIFATRIERSARGPASLLRISGPVRLVGLLGRAVRIGGLTFTVDADSQLDTPVLQLRVGDQVSVWADKVSASVYRIRRLELNERRGTIGSIRRLIGYVRQAPVNGQAVIGRVTVDVSEAQYLNGAASDLIVGRLAVVSGRVQERTLQAERIRFVDVSSDGDVQVSGVISQFVSPAQFEVRHTAIDASDPGVQFEGGDASMLADGVLVRIQGSIVDGRLRANRVQRLP